MMKFLAFLLFPSLALAEVLSITREMLNSIDHKKLLKNAIPVDSKMMPRRLEDTFELSSAMSIKFNSCVSLSIEPSQTAKQVLYNQKYYSYASDGSFVAQKSYILFNACETNYCAYAADDYNLFMVDLDSYLQAMLPYYATKKKNYCSACSASGYECYQGWYAQSGAYEEAQHQDDEYPNYNSNGDGGYDYNPYADTYTNSNGYYQQTNQNEQQANLYGQEQQLNNDGQEQTNNDGDRKLYNNYNYNNYNGQNNNGNNGYNSYNGYSNNEDYQDYYTVVDCDTCKAMGCFNDEDNYQNGQYTSSSKSSDEIDVGTLAQWASSVRQCYDTGATWADVGLYAGFMCNAKGNGIEIGLFLDDECSLYSSLESFSDIASEQDLLYMQSAQDVVTYPFKNTIDCSDKLSYRPVSYESISDSTTYASYPCQQLFQGDTIRLDDCEEKNYQTAEDYYNGKYVNAYKDEQYSWYHYTLSQNGAQDNEEACRIINHMEGEYSPLYQDKSGESFDYGDVVPRYKPVADGIKKTYMGDWETFGVVIMIVAAGFVIGASIWTYNSCFMNELQKLSNKESEEEKGERFIVLEDGDGKVIL